MALIKSRAPALPQPGQVYNQRTFSELVRVIQLYFTQLDSKTANYASSYLADKFYLNSMDNGPFWSGGAGSPEGAVTAPIGSIYSRTDGGASTTMYVKESGTGNTGWVAK